MGSTASAEAEFNERFPDGYELIEPSREGALCGLFALRDSIRAQIPTLRSTATSVASLSAVLKTQAQGAKDFQMDNEHSLRLDQLALVLQECLKRYNIHAQLGLIYVPGTDKGKNYAGWGRIYRGKQRRYLVLGSGAENVLLKTVWIHSDNIRANEWSNATWRGIKPIVGEA